MDDRLNSERKVMDGADEVIIRYALGQRRDKLPKDLALLLDSPTWAAQDLVDALHERASRDRELARNFVHLLAHHPHRSKLGIAANAPRPQKLSATRVEINASSETSLNENEKIIQLKRSSLANQVEESFFPGEETKAAISLEQYIQLMQALGLAKSLRGLRGIESNLEALLARQRTLE